MQFFILSKTYDSFGAWPALHECARRLARGFGEVAFGLETTEVIVWYETAVPTRPSLEGLRARFRQEMPRKPFVRFEAKRQRLRLAYESKVPLAMVADRYELPAESLGEFLREHVDVLESLRSTLVRKPGLDFEGFIEAIRNAETAVCALGSQESTSLPETARYSTGPWWERFGVDWSQYHPRAREILDDPFYWDPSNDESPHAVNAGGILLADFRRWRAKHPTDPPWDFLVQQYRRNGDLGRFNEFRATDPADYISRDGYIAAGHDRHVIALAFALLKVDGVCDQTVGTVALEALARRCDADVASRLGWKLTPNRITAASKLRDDLRLHVGAMG